MESMVSNPFWRDRPVFLTGGSGFLGGWLVKALLGLQAHVIILLRDWNPQSFLIRDHFLNQTTMVQGDLSDSLLLERILSEYEINTVFHLAAQTIVPIANTNPLSTFQSNIAGTWNLLEACRRCAKNISQVIIASSDKAYGEVNNLAYKEDTPLKAIFPYDVSKACADMISISYAKTWDVPVAITRCGNFFGGGDLNWNRIVPGTIRHILRNNPPIIRSNGMLVRDYIYIEDAVSAYLLLAEKMAVNKAIIGEAFNFSNNHPLSVIQLTEAILAKMNSSLKPIILNEASAEIENQYLDSSKAREILAWQPLFNMKEGLKRTIRWYENFFEARHYEMS